MKINEDSIKYMYSLAKDDKQLTNIVDWIVKELQSLPDGKILLGNAFYSKDLNCGCLVANAARPILEAGYEPIDECEEIHVVTIGEKYGLSRDLLKTAMNNFTRRSSFDSRNSYISCRSDAAIEIGAEASRAFLMAGGKWIG